MGKLATIYALCYGDYRDMHMRLVTSLKSKVPEAEADIVIWCNQVSPKSLRAIKTLEDRATIHISDENVPKYKVMRELFHGEHAPETPWLVWFDDDSYIKAPDWWQKTAAHIEQHPEIRYMGQPWYVHHLKGQWDFIRKATWFKGREPEQCKTRTKGVTQPGITFAQGAYWWLRRETMQQLDWPDPRLNHNGGDTLLGEAIRQQGLTFTKFKYGVEINKGKRRGFHEKPAGSDKDVRR